MRVQKRHTGIRHDTPRSARGSACCATTSLVSVFSSPRRDTRRENLRVAIQSSLACAACAVVTSRTSADAGRIEITVKTVTDEPVSGYLLSMSMRDGVRVRTAMGTELHVALEDIVQLSTGVTAQRTGGGEHTVRLTNGDILHGDLVDGPSEAVSIETMDLGLVSVPIEAVASVYTASASKPAHREAARWFKRAPKGEDDRILLTNGDSISGFVTSIGAEGIAVDSTLGETRLPHRLIVAVRLASPGMPAPPRPHLVVMFRNSGRLTVAGLEWSSDEAKVHLRDQRIARGDPVRIVRVDVVGGRWEWLSAHRPISYEHTPLLSLGWEYSIDRDVLGGPITVGGRTFERGVGVHSRSKLTYDLRGAYRELVTSFGIDDDSGPHADVSVVILVDGKRRFERAHVRRGPLEGPVRLDVTHAKRIELVVDFGDNGDVQDRFDWVEPALIR